MYQSQKSIYIGNSVWTKKKKKNTSQKALGWKWSANNKFFNPLSLQSYPSNNPDWSESSDDQKSNDQNSDNQYSKCEKYFDYKQLLKSFESEVKSGDFNSGYKLRLTVLLQYLKFINYNKPKIKISLNIAQQLNKVPYFACYFKEWEKLVKNSETILILKWENIAKLKVYLMIKMFKCK